MKRFIPVKITDKQWADKLLSGEVFMRPLHEFGCWSKTEDASLENSFRADINEGTSAIFADINDCDFFKGFEPDFKNSVQQVSFIDSGEIQFYKIFSLYCMEYEPETDLFIKPDPQIKEFGNTAVIIRDYNEFIERFGKALFTKYNHVIAMMDRVSYYSSNETKQTNPLFDKLDSYSYQNELRIVMCELEHNIFALGPNAETAMSIVEDLNKVILHIGDISDIAFEMPIDDFLEHNFPEEMKLRFPMSDKADEPSNYDGIVEWTREQMKNYHTNIIKPMITIG